MAKRASRKANGHGKPGHNSGQGAPQETVERWREKIVVAQAAVEKAAKPLKTRKAEYQVVVKAAKKDGVNTTALLRAIELNKLDMIQVATDTSDLGKYLRWMGSPLGVQLNLFSTDQMPVVMKASVDGKRCGLAGGNIDDNPYKPGSEEFEAYRTQWHVGQSELMQDAFE